MAVKIPTFYPTRINMRVPNMKYAADVVLANGVCKASMTLAAPVALATGGIGTFAVSSTAITNTSGGSSLPHTFGRTTTPFGRQLNIRGTSTAADAVCTFIGKDYLGQPMGATATLNSTTQVQVSKAFMEVNTIISGSNADASVVHIGWSDTYGVPYKAKAIEASLMNDAAATAFTLTPGTTASQSLAAADPKGALLISTAADGTRTFIAHMIVDETNLHGNAHVAS